MNITQSDCLLEIQTGRNCAAGQAALQLALRGQVLARSVADVVEVELQVPRLPCWATKCLLGSLGSRFTGFEMKTLVDVRVRSNTQKDPSRNIIRSDQFIQFPKMILYRGNANTCEQNFLKHDGSQTSMRFQHLMSGEIYEFD